jgi:hypothetical protein
MQVNIAVLLLAGCTQALTGCSISGAAELTVAV